MVERGTPATDRGAAMPAGRILACEPDDPLGTNRCLYEEIELIEQRHVPFYNPKHAPRKWRTSQLLLSISHFAIF